MACDPDLAFTFAIVLFAFAVVGTVMLPHGTDVIKFGAFSYFTLL